MAASVPERVRKATNGRIEETVSDSLVAPAQIASAVRDGRLPMSAALHTYLASDEPRMGIFNLPGLINNIEECQKVSEQVRGAMAELQKDAFGTYSAFVEKALDNMRKNGVEPWTASPELRAAINDPKYAQPAFDSWLSRAKEVGVDGRAYVNQVRAALGRATQ